MNDMILIDKANLAKKILSNDKIPYIKSKNYIVSLFTSEKMTEDIVNSRLAVIDAYYSTNMNKRYYGIEDISNEICTISSSKTDFNAQLLAFLESPDKNNPIHDLFTSSYGLRKNGCEFGNAVSLISKYAYFSTGFEFPIYDSIVREIFPLFNEDKKLDSDIVSFLKVIKEFLISTGIENFDKLDNLLWLIGKIRRGNYSLILSKGNYKKLTEIISCREKTKSSAIDKKIIDYVNSNLDYLPSNVFSTDLIEMIRFSYGLGELKQKKRDNEV